MTKYCHLCDNLLMEHINWTPGRKERGQYICSPCYRAKAKRCLEAQEAADPVGFKERKAKWRKENREAFNARLREPNRKWRAANKERLKELVKDWQRRNPEKVAEYKRRASEKAKEKARLKREQNPTMRRKRNK